MPSTAALLRRTAGLLAIGLVGSLAACSDDDDDGSPGADVEIERVRFTVTPAGGTPILYTVTANSAADAPIQLRVGASTVTATPLDDNNQVVDEAPEFELRMLRLPAGITFTPNGTLTGTLTVAGAITTPVEVDAQMWHRSENHEDYRATFRVTAAP